MTSKERMLRALAREKPDRLPATVHQWQKYHFDTFLGGASDLEAFGMFGLDASIQYFQDMGQFRLADADFTKFSTPEWRDEAEALSADPDHRVCYHTITTPGGTLTYRTEGNRMTTWITECLIKHDDDIRLIDKYMPVPKLDPAPVRRAYDAVGDQIGHQGPFLGCLGGEFQAHQGPVDRPGDIPCLGPQEGIETQKLCRMDHLERVGHFRFYQRDRRVPVRRSRGSTTRGWPRSSPGRSWRRLSARSC